MIFVMMIIFLPSSLWDFLYELSW